MEKHATPHLRRYHDLCAMRDAGQLSPQQFAAEVQKLRWRDGRGGWWMIDPAGVLLFYDGRTWVAAQPPAPAPASPPTASGQAAVSPLAQGQSSVRPSSPTSESARAAVSPSVRPPAPARPSAPPSPQLVGPVTAPAQAKAPAAAPDPARAAVATARPGSGSAPSQGAPSGRSLIRTLSPLLAVVPSLLCGSLWFLYTLIGAFKGERVDLLTPMIVSGLPVLFWLFKKPLDRLMLPVKPVIQSVPKPLRLGICLAIPVFLGCGCSTLTPSGYFALSVSAFISVIVAGVLMRF